MRTTTVKSAAVFASLFVVSLSVQAAVAGPDRLRAGFHTPPASAKPQTWWHWMNGNITRAGITSDLEAMKQIGLSGATIVNVDCGIPAGPVVFMSPQWRGDFKFAVQEADRLGLTLCVENGAGWSNSGGPWNTPANGMQRLASNETRVRGPLAFDQILAKPEPPIGDFHDIAVLAYPLRQVTTAKPNAASSSTLKINRAVYFAPTTGKSIDVTARLLDLRKRGKTSVGVNSTEMGGDPAPWEVKQLKLDFSLDKTPGTLAIDEGATLIFPIDAATLSSARRQEKTGMDSTFVAPPTVIDGTDFAAVPHEKVIDLAAKLAADGHLRWDVPAGDWKILRIGYMPIGIENYPAPAGGRGLEIDKLSKTALDAHWAGCMQKVLDDIGPLAGKALNSSLIDSYEVGRQDWTPNFREEFRKRRGYDPVNFLPTFTHQVVDSPAVTERFLWDMRRTVADLFAENYYGHFAELCRDHGLLSATEAYTGPYESMQCGASADVVMGEFWTNSVGNATVKMASSIAHTNGQSIVAAEAFTSWANDGKWQNDPYSLKMLGDLMFCQGVNRYVFHRYAMQPWPDRAPGMTMGEFGFMFERPVTWWTQGKAWIDYLSRCEFLLQQGRSVADVAYFNGQSAPALTRIGNPPTPTGYDFDAVAADVLLHKATVKDGRLTLASGASYAALVLPPIDANLTPPILRRLDELAHAGATLVGPRPQHSPSLANYPACDEQVTQLANELWGPCDGETVFEHNVGKGRVVWGKSLADVLATQNLRPDFAAAGDPAGTGFAYAHRIDDGADIYFVSNQRQQFDSADCTFRVTGKSPELWHADTGVIEPAAVWNAHDGLTTVHLNFDPAGSVFVIFRDAALPSDHAVTASSTTRSNVSIDHPPAWEVVVDDTGRPAIKSWTDGQFELHLTGGKTLRPRVEHLPPVTAIEGPWNLSFPPHWGAPALVKLDRLVSWPEHPDAGVRYFSGTAAYENEVDIAADRLSARRELWLDLGAVKNLAQVSLNGHELGVLWKPPFRVNVTSAAKVGPNHLVIKVTNLWPNRLIGDEQLPPDCEWTGTALKAWPQWLLEGQPSPTGRLTFTTWRHWKKDDALLSSGLLGPVMLSSAEVSHE